MRRLIQVSSCLTLLFSLVAFQFAPLVTVTQAEKAEKQEKSDSAKLRRPGGKHKTLDPAGISRLKENTGGRAKITLSDATGGARFVRLAPGERSSLSREDKSVSPQGKSASFLKEYGSVFGLRNADAELQVEREDADRQGGKHLTYKQVYNGVPVFAGTLKTHFDADANLNSVNGTIIPEINVNPNPSRTSQEAAAAALAVVSQDTGAEGLNATNAKLYIYRTGLAQGVDGENYLAWEVEVKDGGGIREFVYVDAHSGKVVDQQTGIIDGLNRRAYNGNNLPQASIPTFYPNNPYWVEGNTFPTASTEANNMIIASKETYDFFNKAFGRDSFDGLGATMDAIFNRGYSCPNASWNGTFISFCPGMTSDDVTAHEWGHAYTQYTHGLIYQWQPGALNESYSDIWGETVDLINNRGTDAPGGLRDASGDNCSNFTPFPPSVKINSPAAIAGIYGAGRALFGPALTNTGLTGNVELANDGSTAIILGPAAAATVNDGCQPIGNVSGKIALIDRGNCGFKLKVKNAQDGGATGVIIANIASSANSLSNMADDPTITTPITIPAVNVLFSTGNTIKSQLANTVNASLRLNAPVGAYDNSYRWLVGEDDTATGLTGALRDMWRPVCQGNPGKVSDTDYGCSTADQGGVHDNSGVPNHAYALIVDGGTYNGQTVTGIGLTKAAHIYYRAMTVYQHSASDFADHADAIEQSAADLLGQNLPDLSTGAPSGQTIIASDITQIQKAMLAVEMRTPPTQCNFQPLLGQNPPADPACGTGTAKHTLFADNFEGDTSAWTVSYDALNVATFIPRNWSVSNSLPDNRAGSAFFAPNLNNSTCANNQAGVLHLTSPSIALPANGSAQTLIFDQWVATEGGFDGGQLMISVNGGPYTLVPAANFIYNAYNTTLLPASGNDNPRAGQQAWSGTDGGAVDGSWGKSIVNLSGLAAAGSIIQLRWDLSSDCASGSFGWYVDNVNLYDCEPDGDGDGVADAYDNCPTTANSSQADFDNDGIGDACDAPSTKDQCKNGVWQQFIFPRSFNNQGDCIQWFNTGK
ncbi:MAG TPA: M4 family metallopeptidase [Pyrinomonadaceae bacterium]|jgi:Zn-dependent metalloprotease